VANGQNGSWTASRTLHDMQDLRDCSGGVGARRCWYSCGLNVQSHAWCGGAPDQSMRWCIDACTCRHQPDNPATMTDGPKRASTVIQVRLPTVMLNHLSFHLSNLQYCTYLSGELLFGRCLHFLFSIKSLTSTSARVVPVHLGELLPGPQSHLVERRYYLMTNQLITVASGCIQKR
jgi:hypothetical protein